MLEPMKRMEHFITILLIMMMTLVIWLAVIELAWTIAKDIITPPLFFLGIDELLEIFGLFLLVLIGVEMVETLRAYLDEGAVRVQVVLMASMIAVARKIITLDFKNTSPLALLGIAAIVIALAIAHRLLRHAHEERSKPRG